MEVTTQTEGARPLLARRVPGAQVTLASAGIRVGAPHAASGKPAGLQLVKEGDQVRQIIVTCECGHTITLICEQE